MLRPINVLIVDDSALVRKMLTDIIRSDPEMRVVGTASNGLEAIKAVAELDPDVVTMDIHMPEMDGLTALEYIMRKNPRPVLMLSVLTRQGAVPTIKSLELGAVDFIAKPASVPAAGEALREEVLNKIRTAASAGLAVRRQAARTARRVRRVLGQKPAATKAIVFGASAGGPKALADILPELPGDIPAAIIVVQHMPPIFTRTFAERLDSRSDLDVKEAESGDRLEHGLALVAPGGYNLIVRNGASQPHVHLQDPGESRVTPDIDLAMASVAAIYGRETIGILLTGMGTDGAAGMAHIKEARGKTVAQDEATSLVFGMPKAAIERKAVDRIVPLGDIPGAIQELL